MKSECRFVRFKRFCQTQYPEYTRYNMYRCGLATEELDFEKLLDRRPLALAPRPAPPATHQVRNKPKIHNPAKKNPQPHQLPIRWEKKTKYTTLLKKIKPSSISESSFPSHSGYQWASSMASSAYLNYPNYPQVLSKYFSDISNQLPWNQCCA